MAEKRVGIEGINPLGLSNSSNLLVATLLPASYWAMKQLSQNADKANAKTKDEKEKVEEQKRLSALWEAVALSRWYEISQHRLRLNINGRSVEMTQGELRQAMIDRLNEIYKERDQLLITGGNHGRILELDGLASDYEDMIERISEREADAATIGEIEDLAEGDPPLASTIFEKTAEDLSSDSKNRTSFSSELSRQATGALATQFNKCPASTPQSDMEDEPFPEVDAAFDKFGL